MVAEKPQFLHNLWLIRADNTEGAGAQNHVFVHEPSSSEDLSQAETTDLIDISADCVRLRQSGVAEFIIRGGGEIAIRRVAGADPKFVDFYLHSLAIPTVLHQRGVFPLHASGIEFNGEAALLVGESGSGKSTLSASLLECGAKLIADDQICLYPNDRGQMEAHPGLQRLHLSDDAALATGRKLVAMEERFGAKGKSYYPTANAACVPVPVRALYYLEWTDDGNVDPHYQALEPFEALLQLRQGIYYHSLVNALGNERAFLKFAEVFLAQVPCFRMYRPRRLNLLPQSARALLGHMSGLRSGN